MNIDNSELFESRLELDVEIVDFLIYSAKSIGKLQYKIQEYSRKIRNAKTFEMACFYTKLRNNAVSEKIYAESLLNNWREHVLACL